MCHQFYTKDKEIMLLCTACLNTGERLKVYCINCIQLLYQVDANMVENTNALKLIGTSSDTTVRNQKIDIRVRIGVLRALLELAGLVGVLGVLEFRSSNGLRTRNLEKLFQNGGEGRGEEILKQMRYFNCQTIQLDQLYSIYYKLSNTYIWKNHTKKYCWV